MVAVDPSLEQDYVEMAGSYGVVSGSDCPSPGHRSAAAADLITMGR